jgi:hypothetical protein
VEPYAPDSWPRFTADTGGLAPAVRRAGPQDPWPRWGWFPREQRAWLLAPGPALIVRPPVTPSFASFGASESDAPPLSDARPAASAGAPIDPRRPIEAHPVRPRVAREVVDAVDDEAPSSTALVPVRRDLVLSDAARAARRAAPVAAVASLVAVAAMALFRRR